MNVCIVDRCCVYVPPCPQRLIRWSVFAMSLAAIPSLELKRGRHILADVESPRPRRSDVVRNTRTLSRCCIVVVVHGPSPLPVAMQALTHPSTRSCVRVPSRGARGRPAADARNFPLVPIITVCLHMIVAVHHVFVLHSTLALGVCRLIAAFSQQNSAPPPFGLTCGGDRVVLASRGSCIATPASCGG